MLINILAYGLLGMVAIAFIVGIVCWIKGVNETISMNESDSDIRRD